MNNYKTFETVRLLLQPTTEADAQLIVDVFNTPKWLKFIGDRNINTVEQAKADINNRMLVQLEKLGYSNYTIIRKSDQAKVGICGLYDRKGLEGIDVGFALLPDYEQLGYAFEATNKIIQAAFQEFGLTELKGITDKENIASQKLLEKLGLKLMSTTRLSADDDEILVYYIKNNE